MLRGYSGATPGILWVYPTDESHKNRMSGGERRFFPLYVEIQAEILLLGTRLTHPLGYGVKQFPLVTFFFIYSE